jgi:hypothetical protein
MDNGMCDNGLRHGQSFTSWTMVCAIMVYVITKALRHGQMLGITCDDGGGGTPMI